MDFLFHGFGRLRFPDGAIYEGEFKAGMADGSGKFVGPTGLIYVGQWVKDHQQG